VRHRAVLSGLLLLAAAGLVPPSSAQLKSDAAGKDFSLPIFTREGFRSMLVRASSGRTVESNRVELTDMHLTLFSGDATNRIETIILSPVATFLPETRVARGEQSVRLINDNVDASGTKWVYYQQEKRISLDQNVRVVFKAELKDLIK
jgi:hypothetical protein